MFTIIEYKTQYQSANQNLTIYAFLKYLQFS